MIPRYSRPEMAAVWAPETRFGIWLDIERHALDAQVALGQAPQEAADALDRAMRAHPDALVDPAKIDAIERETRHDVIAFLTNLANHVGPEARFIHQGLTSSDVLDTCLAVQLDRAGALLADGVDAVASALKRRAFEHKLTLCVGRSHGVHAEPTSFGLKLAGHYAEFVRAAEAAEGGTARDRDLRHIGSGRGPSRASIRRWKPMSRRRWGSRRSRSRPR